MEADAFRLHPALHHPGGEEVLKAQKPRRARRVRGGEDLLRGAFLEDPASLEDHQPVGQARELRVVAHRQGGQALPADEGGEFRQDLVLGQGVQGARGFVQEEEFGLSRQGPGQGHPLPLPPGKLPRPLVGVLQEAYPLQEGQGPRLAVPPLQGEGHVLPGGHVGEEGEVLGQVAHGAPFRGKAAEGGALCGEEARQGLEEAGLARPALP